MPHNQGSRKQEDPRQNTNRAAPKLGEHRRLAKPPPPPPLSWSPQEAPQNHLGYHTLLSDFPSIEARSRQRCSWSTMHGGPTKPWTLDVDRLHLLEDSVTTLSTLRAAPGARGALPVKAPASTYAQGQEGAKFDNSGIAGVLDTQCLEVTATVAQFGPSR